jgi:hypothetical protein
MARAALMSPAHFSRKFRAAYGETPYSYLMTRRIERAKALLRQGMSVTDACVAVGCTSLGEVRNDVASDGFRWVTLGAPGQDVDIVLSQPHGGRSQTEGDALLSLVTQGSLQAAIFRSDDLDTTFEKVRASGAEV